ETVASGVVSYELSTCTSGPMPDLYRPTDVLELLFPTILKLDREPVADILIDPMRDRNPARARDLLQPRGDVDAVPEDVAIFDDDIPECNSDAESDLPGLR